MCRLYQFDQYEINLLLCDFQARTEGGGGASDALAPPHRQKSPHYWVTFFLDPRNHEIT